MFHYLCHKSSIKMSSPDVLIYVQTVKNYFNSNDEAKKYFLEGANENLFYRLLTEFSEKNFEKNGEPALTQEQFEMIRKLSRMNKPMFIINDNVFLNVGDYGSICLN